MTVYKEFQCPDCGERKEVNWSKGTRGKVTPLCHKCNKWMVWAPTAMTFALKGSGWTPKGQ